MLRIYPCLNRRTRGATGALQRLAFSIVEVKTDVDNVRVFDIAHEGCASGCYNVLGYRLINGARVDRLGPA